MSTEKQFGGSQSVWMSREKQTCLGDRDEDDEVIPSFPHSCSGIIITAPSFLLESF